MNSADSISGNIATTLVLGVKQSYKVPKVPANSRFRAGFLEAFVVTVASWQLLIRLSASHLAFISAKCATFVPFTSHAAPINVGCGPSGAYIGFQKVGSCSCDWIPRFCTQNRHHRNGSRQTRCGCRGAEHHGTYHARLSVTGLCTHVTLFSHYWLTIPG